MRSGIILKNNDTTNK